MHTCLLILSAGFHVAAICVSMDYNDIFRLQSRKIDAFSSLVECILGSLYDS